MVKDIHEILDCPDCASMDIVYNDKRQQVVCKVCGLIYEPLMPREEANYFQQEIGPAVKTKGSGRGRS